MEERKTKTSRSTVVRFRRIFFIVFFILVPKQTHFLSFLHS